MVISGLLPALVTVTAWVAPVVPTVTDPKLRLCGLWLKTGCGPVEMTTLRAADATPPSLALSVRVAE